MVKYKVITTDIGTRGAIRRVNYTGKVHSLTQAKKLKMESDKFDKKYAKGVGSIKGNARIVKVRESNNSPFGNFKFPKMKPFRF